MEAFGKGDKGGMVLGGTLLRLGLGVLFAVAGLNKFIGGYFAFAEGMTTNFAETWLPAFVVIPFAYVLPFLEVVVGALLVVGLFTRLTLVVTGLLLIVLAFGMMLQGQASVVSANLTYVLMAAVALGMLGEGNPYSLDALRCK